MTLPAHRSISPGDLAAPAAALGVPLMDPRRIYEQWGPQAEASIVEILRSHAYVKGKHVAGLEEEFSAYVGTRHAVAVDSCTDALYLVLRAVLQGRPKDQREVVLPTFTFVATAGAVVNAGGRPVFADVCPETHNMDPESLAARMSPRTAAVIPVHIFGNPMDVDALRDVVRGAPGRNGSTGEDVFMLEDAAQAVHASVAGRRAGALADAGTFSFYPSKNVAAAGDGGIVTTDDDGVADTVRALRDHGQTRKLYDHDFVGTNSRMDEIQAAVIRVKLPLVDEWTRQRQAIAQRYDAAFEGLPIRRQRVAPHAASAYHLYTIRVDDRDEVRERLRQQGIATGVYYPMPLHRQSCFARFAPDDCPEADALASDVLSLPCFPGLAVDEQTRVIEALRRVLAR